MSVWWGEGLCACVYMNGRCWGVGGLKGRGVYVFGDMTGGKCMIGGVSGVMAGKQCMIGQVSEMMAGK